MKKLLLITCGLAIAAAVEAQIIHVPGDYPTIQQGIEAANNGDTVLVSDGTYYEQINFLGKRPLMVASQYLLDGDTNHIANTIIDGSQIAYPDSSSIVYFLSGEDTTSILCGFTLTNGHVGTAAAHPTGFYFQSGGAVYIFGSGAKIVYNHITQNSLNGVGFRTTGAGISAGQWWEDSNWVVIDHNTIDNNSCYSDFQQTFGTGISVTCNTRITNNVISDNVNHGSGSAIGAAAGIFAGGELFWQSLTAVVINNKIKNNVAISENNYGGGAGGAFQCNSVIFQGNIVENNEVNTASSTGGGVVFWAPRTGSIFSGNTFRQNIINGSGGGLYLQYLSNNVGSGTVMVENNYFIDNTAINAGALSTISVPVTLQNNVFSGNHADNNAGALYLWGNSVAPNKHFATLINNSFYGNTATMNGGAILSYLAKPMIFNSIFWNDVAANGQEIYLTSLMDTIEMGFSIIDINAVQGGYVIDGGGSINEDPLFEDIELLTISEFSPCVNTGTEEYICHCGDLNECPHYDIIGTYRPHGGYVDMGAYEFDFGTGIKPHAFQPASNWHSVYPNPFTDQAKLSYELDTKTQVEINLYNSSGELIQIMLSELQDAGDHELQFTSGNLLAGIYFYRITTDSKQATGRMVLLK